jgi:hypothetical protein
MVLVVVAVLVLSVLLVAAQQAVLVVLATMSRHLSAAHRCSRLVAVAVAVRQVVLVGHLSVVLVLHRQVSVQPHQQTQHQVVAVAHRTTVAQVAQESSTLGTRSNYGTLRTY